MRSNTKKLHRNPDVDNSKFKRQVIKEQQNLLINLREQIEYLEQVLEELGSNSYFPWHGEDAINMRDEARTALRVYNKRYKGE